MIPEAGHHVCVRYEHSGQCQRLRGVQAYAAPTHRRDVPGGIRPCVPVRGASHTTRPSSPALGLKRGGVRSSYACPHLRTGLSTGRGCLLGLPRGSTCFGIVCDRVRRRLHRAPRLPSRTRARPLWSRRPARRCDTVWRRSCERWTTGIRLIQPTPLRRNVHRIRRSQCRHVTRSPPLV